MNTIQNVVVGSASADKIKLNLGESHKVPKVPFRFTSKAEDILFNKPIIVFVSQEDLGTTRIAFEEDVAILVEKAKHIQPSYLLAYLANLSQYELAALKLSFIFLQYDPQVKVAEQLDNMLFFREHAEDGSSSGKIDYKSLENKFSKITSGWAISEFIPHARKHSFLNVLNLKGGK